MCIIKYDDDVDVEIKNEKFILDANRILYKWIAEASMSPDSILEIRVKNKTCMHRNYAITKPVFDEIEVKFVICIADDVFKKITDFIDPSEVAIIKSIFQHEIFHCKEIKILAEGNYLPNYRKMFEKIEINSAFDFMLVSGIKTWSEFYACYYNMQLNRWYEIPDLEYYFLTINNRIRYYNRKAKKSEDNKVCISKNFCDTLYKFWYHTVSLVAFSQQNYSKTYIEEIYSREEYPFLSGYFKYIYNKLPTYIEKYPNWLSESGYIQFTKDLLYILKMNGFIFKNEDIHEGLILFKIS